MKRLALVLGALMFVVLVHPAQAQIGTRFLIGGGVQIPTGDFAQYAKTGWHALGGVEFSPPLSPVGFRVDGFYGRSSHEGTTGEATNLYGGLGSVVYHIGAGPARPYVLGSAGFAVHGYDAGSSLLSDQSEGKFTWGGGVGFNLALGGLNAFAEGRYLARGSETQFIPLVVGLTFGGR